jgi:hypothetical protein
MVVRAGLFHERVDRRRDHTEDETGIGRVSRTSGNWIGGSTSSRRPFGSIVGGRNIRYLLYLVGG